VLTSPAPACPTNALVVQPHMDIPDVPSTGVDIPEEIAAGVMVQRQDGGRRLGQPRPGQQWYCV